MIIKSGSLEETHDKLCTIRVNFTIYILKINMCLVLHSLCNEVHYGQWRERFVGTRCNVKVGCRLKLNRCSLHHALKNTYVFMDVPLCSPDISPYASICVFHPLLYQYIPTLRIGQGTILKYEVSQKG